MAERQTYKLNKAVQAVPIQGSGDIWKQVSSTIGTFYDQYVAGETDLLQSQGAQAGLVAATGEEKKKIQMLNAGTVYGQAFNDAAVKAYGAAIELDVQTTINEYANDKNNIENRENFNAAVLQYSDDFVSGIPNPTFKAIALQKIKEVTGPYEREIYKKQKEKDFLKSLVTIDKKFDASVDTAAMSGKEAVQKWYAGYKDFIGREELEGGVTIEEYADTFGKDMYQHFQKIDADLTDMLNVPGNHFDDGAIKARKENAIHEIYQSVFMAEYEQARKEGKGLEFKEKFITDPVAYIKSQPHLSAIFNEAVIAEYPMTTTGTEKEPAMSQLIYKAMNDKWDNDQSVLEFKEEQEEEELEIEQTNNFVSALTSLAKNEGKVTVEALTAQQNKDSNYYNKDEYQFLITAASTSKYDTDDKKSVDELQFYLVTTEDSQQDKLATIKNFVEQNRVSWKTATPLAMNVLEGIMGDVTKGSDYQAAQAALMPYFQKEKTAFGQVAMGQEKIWMTQAIIELQKRTKGGENPLQIYKEIASQYVSLQEENAPVGKELMQFYTGEGKQRTLDCVAAKNYVDDRFATHKNAKTYAQDIATLNRRQCKITVSNDK